MPVSKIRKRDGSVVEFDPLKIRIAMEKSARSVQPHMDLRGFGIIADHAVRHVELAFPDRIPDVESVQDLVERTLMEFGLYEIAKSYILYRAEHAKKREKQAPAPTTSGKAISYKDASGESKKLDRSFLRRRFAAAIADIGTPSEIALDELVMHAESNIYDGITETELGTAFVLAARALIERDPAYDRLAANLALRNTYRNAFGKEDRGLYATTFAKNLETAVEQGRLDASLLDYNLLELAAYLKPERDNHLDFMGVQMLFDRYLLRAQGSSTRLEAPQTFWMRIAMGLALAEEPAKRTEWSKKFYDILSELRYTPSTPTLFHAGTTYPQLSSCYLNMVEDDLHHIFKLYSDNAQLSKYSGGIGTSWTKIRATGALIKSTNLESQGVIPFLRIANDVNIAINRSGKRRGAACVYLETWHYEIEDFCDLRRNTGDERRRTHDINTAHWIPDLFMKRVASDGNWTLFSPDEVPELNDIYGAAFEKKYVEYEKKAKAGEIRLHKTVKAKDLWRKMISMLFETGHPWITFKDPSNVRSPQDHAGIIHNSNLCTEITLNNSKEETAVCNIGSINFARHTASGKMDWKKLQETVEVAIRMLDNTIDSNFYPTEETRTANMRHRPVGLGLMGFQDALYEMDVEFESDAAVKFADESMEFISYHAIRSSALLAKEKGAYESFKGSKWDRGIFPVDTLDLLEKERKSPIGTSRTGKLDWKPVRALVAKHGLRNSNLLAVAPTASISNINGCFPTIEPAYKNLYVKSNMSGEFTVVNKYLVNDLKRLGLWNATMLEALKAADGSVQDISTIPPKIRSKYKTAFEIGASWLVRAAAHRGKWIDQSQSLNIFFQGTSGRALSDIYFQAWHSGLKTTYYLRTSAATNIEKSTVEIAKQRISNSLSNVVTETVVATSPMTTAIAQATVIPEPVASAPMEPTVAPGKACLIDDPDCEACQ